jgi:hypothetical protein
VRRCIPAAWLLLLLLVPAIAWVAGARQPLLEDRSKEPFPAVNTASLQQPSTFAQFDTAFLDRFPARDKALQLHADIALDLFRDSTSPDVALGHNGYLYYLRELSPCTDYAPTGDPGDAVDVLSRELIATGRRPVVVLPRAKVFVHDADIPALDDSNKRCDARLEEGIEQRLATTPGGLAMFAQQRALEQAGKATFLKTDTHWNWRGRELFARDVLNRIRPGLADEVGLQVGAPYGRDTDLTAMLGRPRTEEDLSVGATRTPREALQHVLLIGDSQLTETFLVPRGPFQPIRDVALPGSQYCDWGTVATSACDDAITSSKTIVIEKVARDMKVVTDTCWLPLALTAGPLRGTPASWERVDGGTPAQSTSLVLPASGEVTVRVRSNAADAEPTPRLLRLPLEHVTPAPDNTPGAVALAQEPQEGPPAPCASPQQSGNGNALFLPVPANRRVSDLVIRLTGPPGTVMGAPQEILLDGRPVAGDVATGRANH